MLEWWGQNFNKSRVEKGKAERMLDMLVREKGVSIEWGVGIVINANAEKGRVKVLYTVLHERKRAKMTT